MFLALPVDIIYTESLVVPRGYFLILDMPSWTARTSTFTPTDLILAYGGSISSWH